jgi:hypothetical protein
MPSINQDAIHGLAKDMLEDREKVLHTLLKSLETLAGVEQGCSNVLDNWDQHMKDPRNIEKQLRTALKVNRQLSASMLQVMSVLLIYVTSRDFSAGAATLMARTGDPQEALRAMMKDKMRGR